MGAQTRLDAATLRRLAVRASTCPATIRKVFDGEPVRGLAYHRARLALKEAGLLGQGDAAQPRTAELEGADR